MVKWRLVWLVPWWFFRFSIFPFSFRVFLGLVFWAFTFSFLNLIFVFSCFLHWPTFPFWTFILFTAVFAPIWLWVCWLFTFFPVILFIFTISFSAFRSVIFIIVPCGTFTVFTFVSVCRLIAATRVASFFPILRPFSFFINLSFTPFTALAVTSIFRVCAWLQAGGFSSTLLSAIA